MGGLTTKTWPLKILRCVNFYYDENGSYRNNYTTWDQFPIDVSGCYLIDKAVYVDKTLTTTTELASNTFVVIDVVSNEIIYELDLIASDAELEGIAVVTSNYLKEDYYSLVIRLLIDANIDQYTPSSSNLFIAKRQLTPDVHTNYMLAYNWPNTGDMVGYRYPRPISRNYSSKEPIEEPYDTYISYERVDGVYRPVLNINFEVSNYSSNKYMFKDNNYIPVSGWYDGYSDTNPTYSLIAPTITEIIF